MSGYVSQQRVATRSRGRRWLVPFLALGVGAFALAELGLRLVPAAIPAAILDEFPRDLRRQIEVGQTPFGSRGLVELPRDDGGPMLRVTPPDAVIRRPQHRTDREFNAVEAITTDDTGFCNPPTRRWSVEDAEIIALGDSFTWCFAVAPEDAWPAQLEALTERPTYNLGQGGTGLFEALQILKVYGLPRQPKVVILSMYEGNDVRDALRYWQARRLTEPGVEHPLFLAAEESEAVRREPTANPWWKRISRGPVRAVVKKTPLSQSYLVNLGLGAYQATVSRRPTGEVDFRYDVQVDGRVVPFDTANSIYDLAHLRAVADGDLSPAILEPALASFAEISMEAGFRSMVIYTPAPYIVYQRLGPVATGGVVEVMRRFSRTQREWLRDATHRYGLDYLDLTPVMQQAAAVSPEPLYFPRNQHLTAVGHRVIAAAVAEALRRPVPSKALPAEPASATASAVAQDKP